MTNQDTQNQKREEAIRDMKMYMANDWQLRKRHQNIFF